MTELPDLPSDLIELALKDLVAVENKPGTYRVDMTRWHAPSRTRRKLCLVCLAGAIMAETLKADPAERVETSAFDADTERKLSALECFRTGHISLGIRTMEITNRSHFAVGYYHVTPYGDDPAEFKEDLQMVADILQSEGL